LGIGSAGITQLASRANRFAIDPVLPNHLARELDRLSVLAHNLSKFSGQSGSDGNGCVSWIILDDLLDCPALLIQRRLDQN
jgi:hypothetical protein